MNKREFTIAYVLARAGLVEKFNGEACVTRAGEIYDAIPAGDDDGGWQEWRGEKPYPEGYVDIICRDGSMEPNINSDELIWSVDGEDFDILQWRPARD